MANKKTSWISNDQYRTLFGHDITNPYSNVNVKEEYVNQNASKTFGQMNQEERKVFLENFAKKLNSPEEIKNAQDFHQQAQMTMDASRKAGIIGSVMVGDNDEKSVIEGAIITKTNDNEYTVTFINDKTGSADGSYIINRDEKTISTLNEDSNLQTDEAIDIVINAENKSSDAETLSEEPIPESMSRMTFEGNVENDPYKVEIKTENLIKNNNEFHKNINYSQRVSLNVAPINKEQNVSATMSSNEWEGRLGYILGDSTENNLLYQLFAPTKGIVFQYTPSINMSHSVNYEQTDILHSNLAVQHYKNTPPPTISVKADFTADGPENAEYMYGVLCFLRAMTKCEFGEEVVKKAENSLSSENREGVPPPVLYLNGWGNMINNVPVVITSFGIDLPKEKHYVKLSKYDVWLPTEMSFNIELKIQFNLNKYKHQFDLKKYKEGILSSNTQTENNVTIVDTLLGQKNNNGGYILSTGKEVRKYNGSGWTW